MCVCCCGCREDIMGAPVVQFQSFTQLHGRHGEISRSDVGVCDTAKLLPYLALVEGGYRTEAEFPAWEMVMKGGG